MNIAHTLKKIYEEKKMHIDVGADIIYCNVHSTYKYGYSHRIKDDRMEKYDCFIIFI